MNKSAAYRSGFRRGVLSKSAQWMANPALTPSSYTAYTQAHSPDPQHEVDYAKRSSGYGWSKDDWENYGLTLGAGAALAAAPYAMPYVAEVAAPVLANPFPYIAAGSAAWHGGNAVNDAIAGDWSGAAGNGLNAAADAATAGLFSKANMLSGGVVKLIRNNPFKMSLIGGRAVSNASDGISRTVDNASNGRPKAAVADAASTVAGAVTDIMPFSGVGKWWPYVISGGANSHFARASERYGRYYDDKLAKKGITDRIDAFASRLPDDQRSDFNALMREVNAKFKNPMLEARIVKSFEDAFASGAYGNPYGIIREAIAQKLGLGPRGVNVHGR